MKDATMSPQRHLDAGIVVYLTPTDRQRLREALRAEGIYSASGWFRQLAIQKINHVAPAQEPSHADT